MKTEEAIFLLEHTGYDDFNLLEHQIKGRLEAIQVILKENQKYKEVIDKIKKICNSVPPTWGICGTQVVDKIEKVLKEVE